MTDKPTAPAFTSLADAQAAIAKMDGQSQGPWWVWGDAVEPLLKDVDFDTMKKVVDDGHANKHYDLYGENTETDALYESDGTVG